MSPASVEPDEISDGHFSNHGFKASTMGAESFLRAASRASGAWPRTSASNGVERSNVADRRLRDRRFRVAHKA